MDSYIQQFGLFAVFIGCLFEGETFALAGGVAAHRGLLSLPQVMAAAFAGSLITDQALFWLARHHREFILATRLAKGRGFARAVNWIERFPNLYVLMFRFIYGIRLASPIAIGASRISSTRYMVLNGVAALIWASAVTSAGYAFSQVAHAIFGEIQSIEKVLIAGAAVAAVLAWATHLWLARNRRSGAEQLDRESGSNQLPAHHTDL